MNTIAEKAWRQALAKLEGPTKVARQLALMGDDPPTRSAVSQWKHCPPRRAAKIAILCNHEPSVFELLGERAPKSQAVASR